MTPGATIANAPVPAHGGGGGTMVAAFSGVGRWGHFRGASWGVFDRERTWTAAFAGSILGTQTSLRVG